MLFAEPRYGNLEKPEGMLIVKLWATGNTDRNFPLMLHALVDTVLYLSHQQVDKIRSELIAKSSLQRGKIVTTPILDASTIHDMFD